MFERFFQTAKEFRLIEPDFDGTSKLLEMFNSRPTKLTKPILISKHVVVDAQSEKFVSYLKGKHVFFTEEELENVWP